MQIVTNWTDPINWLITATLLILLIGQLWFIARNKSLITGRKWLRASLNVLLWLILTGYFLKIQWSISRPVSRALLVADNVPPAFVRHLKDSLHIQESFTSRNVNSDFDSVTLAGQNFPIQTLTQLSNTTLNWIPYSEPDQLLNIRWKGIVRQGEIQHVTGRIMSSKDQILRLRFGNKTLDSVALREGNNTFALRFPAFEQGRSQTELVLNGSSRTQTTLDTIRFFTQRTEPLTVQFLLNSPDFESKTLANWLGKHGHSVQLSATLSKQITSNVSINKTGKSAEKKVPDLIITEPANDNNVVVRKAIADGKAVFFINLTNPETDCRLINQFMGSRWQVRKTTNEATVPVGNGLTALPYRFTDNLNQFTISGYPIAVQQTSGRVGVSLLSETYPLSLSGDSVTYNRIWMAVLTRLSPAGKNTIQVDAPIYSGIQQPIYINNPANRVRTLQVGNDTLPLTYSPINERSAVGTSLFGKVGWQSLQDSLAVYVNGPDEARTRNSMHDRQVINQFILAHEQYQITIEQTDRKTTAQLPDWAWLFLLIVCFAALWIEPKF